MLKLEFTGQFKRDYKKVVRRGCKVEELFAVIKMLQEGTPLPSKYRDHELENSRNYRNMRECHIGPDWLLVYQVLPDRLLLKMIRTGTHSDLF